MRVYRPTALLIAGLGIALIAGGDVQAQSVTKSGQVTVVRGNDHPGDSRQHRSLRRESGVAVVRGIRPSLPPTAPADRGESTSNAAPFQVGGRNLWFVDPTDNRVIGCTFRTNVYGERTIQCTSGRY